MSEISEISNLFDTGFTYLLITIYLFLSFGLIFWQTFTKLSKEYRINQSRESIRNCDRKKNSDRISVSLKYEMDNISEGDDDDDNDILKI